MNSGSETEDPDVPRIPDVSLQDAEAVLTGLADLFFPSGTTGPLALTDLSDAAFPEFEARYKTLLEQIPAVVFMAPLEAGLSTAYVSPHIEAVLGFTQEEWLHDPVRWYYQIHPDDRARWSEEAASLFLSGEPLRSVYRIMARDGHQVWFQCEAKMVRKPDGQPWFIHGVGFDISEIKRAEQALQVAHDQLELRVEERTAELAQKASELVRSNEDLELFAYSASHDLQEPIRNLALYSDLLSRRYEGALDAEAQMFLKVLTDSADRMSRLIRDLLEYTRVSGDFQATENTADANEVMATVIQNLEAAIRESGTIITSEWLPSVGLSAVRLQQVLQNLVLNAIKYRGTAVPRVQISTVSQKEFWLFSVKDNGIGIAPEYRKHIFGIFKRLEHSSRNGGTGMGLAICKRILERAKGQIWVESEPGEGSNFLFTVPIASVIIGEQGSKIR
jgi:PAS domain S-box-containing protein